MFRKNKNPHRAKNTDGIIYKSIRFCLETLILAYHLTYEAISKKQDDPIKSED